MNENQKLTRKYFQYNHDLMNEIYLVVVANFSLKLITFIT